MKVQEIFILSLILFSSSKFAKLVEIITYFFLVYLNIFKVSLQAHAEAPELASKSLFGDVVDCETSVQETQLLPSNDSKYRSFEPGSVKHLQVPDESEKGFWIVKIPTNKNSYLLKEIFETLIW